MNLDGISEISLAAILAEEFADESYAASARDLVECEIGRIAEDEGFDCESTPVSPFILAWALYRIRWRRYLRRQKDATASDAERIGKTLERRWARNSKLWTDGLAAKIKATDAEQASAASV